MKPLSYGLNDLILVLANLPLDEMHLSFAGSSRHLIAEFQIGNLHNVSFSINPGDRPGVSNWLINVKKFFATTAASVSVPSTVFQPSQQSSQKKNVAVGDNQSYNLTSNIGGGLIGSNVVKNASNADLLKLVKIQNVNEVLEGATIHYIVHLISILGNYNEDIRVGSARLLFNLSCVFDKKVMEYERDLERIILGLETDDRGYSVIVHELFHLIGPSFTGMVVAIIAGLECFYQCVDWGVRSICVSALTRLVFENEKVFLGEDQLCAIWNLFFSLNSLPQIINSFPDRIVTIETVLETEAIKGTLTKIFEILNQSASNSKSEKGQKTLKDVYMLFLNMLTPHDEYAYDLLPWALETYTTNLVNNIAIPSKPQTPESGTPSKPNSARNPSHATDLPVPSIKQKEFLPLLDFVLSLSNHFRAIPPLVRYGACVCLHSALKVFPSLLQENRQLYPFVISGAMDTDYLSQYLYVSMLEVVKSTEAPSSASAKKSPGRRVSLMDTQIQSLGVFQHFNPIIRSLVTAFRHKDNSLHYDDIFGGYFYNSPKETTLKDILDEAVKNCPPIQPKLIHKMANSLDYLSKSTKLRQLELIRIWAGKSEKVTKDFDTFLVQTLLPLFNTTEEDVQLATLRVMSSLMPKFKTASSADLLFAWEYFGIVLDPKGKSFINNLYELCFHKDPGVRVVVYDVMKDLCLLFKSENETSYITLLSMLLICIGEQDKTAQEKLLKNLSELLAKTEYLDLALPFNLIRDGINEPLSKMVQLFDDLATAFINNKTGLKILIEGLLSETVSDKVWNFFLHDVTENSLVRPDEYGYTRNFIHAPFWTAILYTKLGAVPPNISGDNASRHIIPNTPANKRRFICGFMLCLLPTCGMPDPTFRKTACAVAIKCCIKKLTIHAGMIRGLMEYVSQQMMTNKYWTFQLSALDILRHLVRLKLPGLSQCILLQYMDMALDVAFNTPTSSCKIGALSLLQTFLTIFPSGVSMRLQEIRDTVRACIIDKDEDVYTQACSFYPLIFRSVSTVNAEDFYRYLQNEISVLNQPKDSALIASDPLVSQLSSDEEFRVIMQSILCMGNISERTLADSIIKDLMPLVRKTNSKLRWAALSSILAQIQFISDNYANTILWEILPLYFDPNPEVRQVFVKFITKVPTYYEVLCKFVTTHPDDSYVVPQLSWEDLLLDTAVLLVNSQSLIDCCKELPVDPPFDLDTQIKVNEDAGLYIPTISQKMMQRIKSLAKTITGGIQSGNVGEVFYFLQQLKENASLQGVVVLTMSELGCHNTIIVDDLIQLFCSNLGEEVTCENKNLIESCILGLGNLIEFFPEKLETIFQKLTGSTLTNEGDILALFYLSEFLVKKEYIHKASDLLSKCIPYISSQRYTVKKRIYAIYLTVELSLSTGMEDMVKVLDAIMIFIENAEESDLLKVYGCLGKLLAVTGPKHSLFRNLLQNLKKALSHKDSLVRLKSLSIFQIFVKHISDEEVMSCCYKYLADSNREVRNKAKEMMAVNGVFDFALAALKKSKSVNNSSNSSSGDSIRATLLENLKLPSIAKLGLTINPNSTEEKFLNIPLLDLDPYNIKYYSSEVSKKFVSRYGLPESKFKFSPLPLSIIGFLEEKATSKKVTPEHIQKYQFITTIDCITILHECMKKYPQLAQDMIEGLIAIMQSLLTEQLKSDDVGEGEDLLETDLESDIHHLNLLSNLLMAYDGITEKALVYTSKLKEFIITCNSIASTIRESLYLEMEESFFFFNDYVDVPIVSEEQYLAFEEFKRSNQEATLEIVKSGKTDKLTSLEEQKDAMNVLLDVKSEQLRRMTNLALHGISGFGQFYALSSCCPNFELANSFIFLTEMLENEHRGIRIAAVEALSLVCKLQFELSVKEELLTQVQRITQLFINRLVEENKTLYRKKADMAEALAKLVVYVPDRATRLSVISILVKFWSDADSEEASSVELMNELARLMSSDEYTEKEELQRLLKWRFSF
ncbi:hypothetical protein HK099_005713 [Clydaea vesicula]|uniref:Uncharacterized protein n=1 Tax=Clydaea vesicula TaxID=447962 RepID=A0AAD5XYL2_9FUNG|nr:hypothetical protein HK099_005713 [Clydaea vesicula]